MVRSMSLESWLFHLLTEWPWASYWPFWASLFLSVQWHSRSSTWDFCSLAKLCPILYDPMDCGMPGLPVLQCLPEFAQTHIRWFSDTIQPSHPLSPSSPPAFNLSQQSEGEAVCVGFIGNISYSEQREGCFSWQSGNILALPTEIWIW